MLFSLIRLVYISWTRAEKFKSFWLLTVYVKLPRHFSIYCMSFSSRSKYHNWCNIHLKSESVTGQPASKLVIMTKLSGGSQTVILALRMKVFAYTILKHYSQTMFTKTVRLLRSGFRSGSVHGRPVSWDNCGWVFLVKLRVSSFPDRFLHYAWTQHSQPIPTLLSQGCMRV